MSIILVSFNRKDLTVACIASLIRVQRDCTFEVIVVDNASRDGAAETILTAFPGARLIRNTKNRGFAAACNQAMAVSSGRYVLLLNNDSRVHGGTLETMTDFLDRNPQVGAVGCKLLNEDGTLQPSTHDLPTTRNLLFNALLNRSELARKHWGDRSFKYWRYDQVREVPFLSGACLMVRRRVIEEVGTLDERFRMYTEDVDWCMRIRQAGWRIVFIPTATITHLGGQSTTRLNRRYVYYGSLLALSHKHYTLSEHWLPRVYWRVKRIALFLALVLTRHRDLDLADLSSRGLGA